jgi:CubicO group peptidase (beta-lactamase class C family)
MSVPRSKCQVVKVVILVFLSLMFISACFAVQKNEKQKPIQSTEELRQQLEKILEDTHTPGASVAIVHREGAEWIAGLGKADVASSRPATPETLFRIGSISKGFVALAVLMLADQGKLSLQDSVHNLAPEVWFENRWEASDPIRVVHLLEHTTGWDDMHLREYALDAPEMGLRAALEYDHHSRTSRWRPGTAMAYCNSGPAVAAYIVEKLTHQRFEEFVEQNLFRPIGMKTATYFQPNPGFTTTLYHNDGKTPYRYWSILYRPAGSINASANDMAAYVQFYLNRGLVNGTQVVPAADIDRMEIPTSTWAAKEGMRAGYGLGNYWSVREGYVYHGHNGGVEGGLSEIGYMPEYNVGYFFSINTANGNGFERVGEAIRAYITRDLQKPPLPLVASLPSSAADYGGWYEQDSPRIELTHFLKRLVGVNLVRFNDNKLVITSLGRRDETFLPVEGTQFRVVPKNGSPEPIPTLELLTPNDDGRFIQAGTMTTLRHIPAWLAVVEIVLSVFVLISMISILLYAPFWILGGLSKRRRRPAERGMRTWPLVAVVSLIVILGILAACSDNLISRLGNLTVWSAGICVSTILFAVAAVASALALWRAPAPAIRRGVLTYSLVVTVALLITAAYLACWGIIGLRTWS